MKRADQECQKMVFSGFHSHKCSKPSKMEHEGKRYCGVHDPLKRKARMDATDRAWQLRWEARDAAEAVTVAKGRLAEMAMVATSIDELAEAKRAVTDAENRLIDIQAKVTP